MKKRITIAAVLLFAVMLVCVGCGELKLKGSWVTYQNGVQVRITFASGSFTMTYSSQSQYETVTGTYTIDGSTVTMTAYVNGSPQVLIGTLSGDTLIIQGIVFTKQ
ncbi:MAG: lipocalin family protein [Spirochaetaceae bacterium]|nr:lipocalin family protein [Spirochaetaceae bacterium]